jgi:predicted ATP-grasp superfamily ATP-dependent carboligase
MPGSLLDRSKEAAGSFGFAKQEPGPAKVDSKRILMVATLFDMPYRVLRCLHASGSDVFVLGNVGSRALRFSRHCRQFFPSDCIIHGGRDEALALEINCLGRTHGIAMVVPSDAPSTRALIAISDLIAAPCFPLPSLEQFDCLNDKWSFSQLCNKLKIPQPETFLLRDAAGLAHDLANGRFQYPVVAKPISRSGGSGVAVLDGIDTSRRLKAINYRPVLVQEFISGEDIGASLYAHEGEIEAIIAHRLRRKLYSLLDHEPIYAELEKIVRYFKLSGVYNFDMRRTPTEKIYYIECNPRFFYKVNLSMIAGINFAMLGLPGAHSARRGPVLAAGAVRMPKRLIYSLLTSGRCSGRDWAMLYHLFSDPVPYLLEKLNLTM